MLPRAGSEAASWAHACSTRSHPHPVKAGLIIGQPAGSGPFWRRAPTPHVCWGARDPPRPLQLAASPRHPALDGGARPGRDGDGAGAHAGRAAVARGARAARGCSIYWSLRGITAPLFLLVSGWAVVAALEQPARGGAGHLSAAGCAGRCCCSSWATCCTGRAGRPCRRSGWTQALLAHFFAFDALQCIGMSLLVGATVLALARGTWSRALVLGGAGGGHPAGERGAVAAGHGHAHRAAAGHGGRGQPVPVLPVGRLLLRGRAGRAAAPPAAAGLASGAGAGGCWAGACSC